MSVDTPYGTRMAVSCELKLCRGDKRALDEYADQAHGGNRSRAVRAIIRQFADSSRSTKRDQRVQVSIGDKEVRLLPKKIPVSTSVREAVESFLYLRRCRIKKN